MSEEARELHYLHNRENLKEIILGEVLVGVMGVEAPEVVDDEVEYAQNENEHGGAPLGLESDHDHDACNETSQADNDSPETPVASEHETDEKEDQKDTASKLEVHLPVLFVQLR